MRVVRTETGQPHEVTSPAARATAHVLIDGDGQLAATQMLIPAGAVVPEHDHGGATSLVIPVTGEVVLLTGNQHERVGPGTVVLVDQGERIELANRTDEPAVLITVFALGGVSADVTRGTTGPGATPDLVYDSLHWVSAGPLRDMEDDTALHFDLAGHPVCLARSQGVTFALLDECSHEQVALSDGDVDEGHIECWLHGSRFDLTTGAPAGPPATKAVPVYPVRITDAGVDVALPSGSSGRGRG